MILQEIYGEMSKEAYQEEEKGGDLLDSLSFCLRYLEDFEEEGLPESWDGILDRILPPVEELPINSFFNILKNRTRNLDEIIKAGIKDILKKRAKNLENQAEDLRRRADEIEEKAKEIVNLIREI